MPLVLRYVNQDGIISKLFMSFSQCKLVTGAAIAANILQFLDNVGLPATGLHGQGYHGAPNMAGKHEGCAAIIKDQCPKARYVHCASHVLNLCVLASCDVDAISRM